MFGKYSLDNIIKAYYENKELIDATIKGQKVEGLDNSTNLILGLDLGLFIFIALFVVGLWIWGLIVTIMYWKQISVIAQVFAVIGLIFPSIGPIVTLLAVYISRAVEKKKVGGRRSRK